jgi:FtsZ-interacting cell division protein ZipA
MLSNLQIILVAGASLIFLIILYIFFKPIFTRKLIHNSITDTHSRLFEDNLKQGELDFRYVNQESDPQELIILNLISMDKSNFNINQVLTLLKNLDAKYNHGFFSFCEISGEEIFRIASGINPGLIELETKTHVLLLALDLHQVSDPAKAFDIMLELSSEISEKLHASICDANRAPLSKQMIEHLKCKAQDVSRIKAIENTSSTST